MRIELLEEFIEFSRDLNFKATAARLHLSPSSFSEHMDKLEREIGFALVTRWPNRALTPQGSRFLKYAHKITRLYAEALRRCASPGSVARQRIRVSCTGMSPRVHDYFFALLAEYGNEHPEVEFVCGEYSKKGGNVRALACGRSTWPLWCESPTSHWPIWSAGAWRARCSAGRRPVYGSSSRTPWSRRRGCVWTTSTYAASRL